MCIDMYLYFYLPILYEMFANVALFSQHPALL